MPTLQELRKRKFKTIKDFSIAFGCSPSKAGMILQGRYQRALSRLEVQHLASVLGVSFGECVDACDLSYAQWCHYQGNIALWQVREGLEAHWLWQEELRRRTEEAVRSDDWAEWRRQYRDPIDRLFGPLLQQEIFDLLGIPVTATPAQIKAAFARKARAMHPDSGGTGGDLDKLVQAKEKALEYAQKR